MWPEIDAVWRSAKHAHSTGKQLRADVDVTKSNGRKSTFDVRFTSVDQDGTILGLCRDVTSDRSREKELEQRATIDQLTGAFNRSQLEVLLTQSIRSARRQKTDGCFLYVDIDGFKRINDNFGHGVGDEALKKVVQVLVKNLRDSDIVGRLGGDEFGLILPGTSVDSAEKKARQLTHVLSSPDVTEFSTPIEVSIGVAPYPTAGWGAADVIEFADEAMYQAKKVSGSRIETTRRHVDSKSDS